MPHLIPFLLSALAATACLDAAPEATEPDETETVQSAIEVTPAPLCPDQHKNLSYVDSCTLPNGQDGVRNCTDHITFHYKIQFPVGFPPPGPVCVSDGVTVTTSCSPCVRIDLPGDGGPGGPLDP